MSASITAAAAPCGRGQGVDERAVGGAGAKLIDTANSAFVDALTTTATLGAAAAVIGALIALAFLPARARAEQPAPLHRNPPEPALA